MRNFKRDSKTSGNSDFDFFLYENMHCTNPTGLPLLYLLQICSCSSSYYYSYLLLLLFQPLTNCFKFFETRLVFPGEAEEDGWLGKHIDQVLDCFLSFFLHPILIHIIQCPGLYLSPPGACHTAPGTPKPADSGGDLRDDRA